MTAAFDTLAAAEALQNAGVDPKPAKAIVAIARDAAGAGRGELATRTDLAELRADLVDRMAALEARMTWRMVGVMAALLAAQGALIVALLQPAAS